MDFIKQYLSQCISFAANNIRLSSEKIEIVGLLRESIQNTESIEVQIRQMKKVTEFARLGIRLQEILNYLRQEKIDFATISEKFKEHSNLIIKDVGLLVETLSLSEFRRALEKLQTGAEQKEVTEQNGNEITERASTTIENEKIKEKFIFDEEEASGDLLFQNFEETIMRPIKPLDAFLKRVQSGEVNYTEYTQFAKLLIHNSELAEKIGTDIIAGMHKILSKALILIRNRELMPGKETIDAMRACLIVIVALVRNKEVDISTYLNRAEDFGEKLNNYKLKE